MQKKKHFTTTEGQDLEAGFNPKLDALEIQMMQKLILTFGNVYITISNISYRRCDGDYQYMIFTSDLKKINNRSMHILCSKCDNLRNMY